MILRELYYFDDKTMEPIEDLHYDNENDKDLRKRTDSRKSKLTLRDINRARKASDSNKKEKQNDLHFIRQMYGLASQAALGG
jgi:hypothetical protein